MGLIYLLPEPRLLRSKLLRTPYTIEEADDRWLSEQSVQPTTEAWNIICTDFFTYSPEYSYDVIFDYTCVPIISITFNLMSDSYVQSPPHSEKTGQNR
jgi:hypothetical protein